MSTKTLKKCLGQSSKFGLDPDSYLNTHVNEHLPFVVCARTLE